MENNLFPITTLEGVQVVESLLIAESLGIEHRAFLQTVGKYESEILNDFGAVAFEMREFKTRQGNRATERVAHLTEGQALFLATLSRNTEQVLSFKSKLVRSFIQARYLLTNTGADITSVVQKAVQVEVQKYSDRLVGLAMNHEGMLWHLKKAIALAEETKSNLLR